MVLSIGVIVSSDDIEWNGMNGYIIPAGRDMYEDRSNRIPLVDTNCRSQLESDPIGLVILVVRSQ